VETFDQPRHWLAEILDLPTRQIELEVSGSGSDVAPRRMA
jgi:hypothetical protein